MPRANRMTGPTNDVPRRARMLPTHLVALQLRLLLQRLLLHLPGLLVIALDMGSCGGTVGGGG